jgi:signal transduction histidine kinase
LEVLRVGVYLTSPELLYDRQQARSRLFSLLILAATVTSVIGFLSARRAYLRQEQLGEMKSNFVSSVSHELRAPLASVRLMAENLERGTITEPVRQRDYYRLIVQECRRLGTLIENVLDFARIEQGRKQYEFEPTDVAALVQRSVQLMQPVAAEKAVTLQVDHPEPPPGLMEAGSVSLDGPAVQQALVNLLDNAIKHSPSGATVTLAVAGQPQPAALLLSVADVGPGIPREEHERIFQRFYRRGPELRRETQGVGIGLSIVRHIVEAHGGQVRVESTVGQGSRFVMELPLGDRSRVRKHPGP